MFSKTIILALFASVALAVPVENKSPYPNALTARDANVRCSSQDGGFGRSADLNTCLDQIIANPQWSDSFECGGRTWFLGGANWNSAADCVGGCIPCLRGSAAVGLQGGKCDQSAGVSARCWLGYGATVW
ncbi:hypothetical protein LTS08_007750 [Lithohypha guttulata]|nr:hypothetical protein LTS08_007750 [Lithohypha guttulata]